VTNRKGSIVNWIPNGDLIWRLHLKIIRFWKFHFLEQFTYNTFLETTVVYHKEKNDVVCTVATRVEQTLFHMSLLCGASRVGPYSIGPWEKALKYFTIIPTTIPFHYPLNPKDYWTCENPQFAWGGPCHIEDIYIIYEQKNRTGNYIWV
jgi:hypothetical protein